MQVNPQVSQGSAVYGLAPEAYGGEISALPRGWCRAAVLTLRSLLGLSSLRVCSVLFPLQGSFLPSVVPIAETPLEFYVVWVQRHRNQSFSQILLERHPALGQRRWGGSPTRNLAVLPMTVCVEEFGVWGCCSLADKPL